MRDGFVKVAAASPLIRVADCDYNADRVIETIRKAESLGVKVLVFPELTLTGVSCYDLLGHRMLLEDAKKALKKVAAACAGKDMLCLVGLPVAIDAQIYSAAAVIYRGTVQGMIPREHVRGSLFSPPLEGSGVLLADGEIVTRMDSDTLLVHEYLSELKIGVELGADMDALDRPALRYAAAGATLICQMAAFPATVDSTRERMQLVCADAKRMKAGLVLAAPGKGESTTDHVYTGLCAVVENGELLAQSEGDDSLAVSEIDVQYLTNLRRRDGDFPCRSIGTERIWGDKHTETALSRRFARHPQLPENQADLPAYCERILDLQVSGLVKRMQYAGLERCVVGISGGVDSTLCLLVCARAIRRMGLPAKNLIACTMPCFGTTSRTKSNAMVMAEQLGADLRVIDIGKSVYQHFEDIGHARDDYSVAFENAQARERTQVLMDLANKVNGLNVGTEDLSEYIDGWCTYNGDHTSMYDVNLGLTKTQVRTIVRYLADNGEDKALCAALYDVLDCPVSPELLPAQDDQITQKSEDTVGSYSLQDFFTHQILVCGFGPRKTFRLAKLAYGKEFSDGELIHWLRSYGKRLVSQQFKRSCLMDGPAVMDFSISPRSGLRMPSDAEIGFFQRELDELEATLEKK
ncbi:MAG: NAD(+) synthase [Oscillospiraceae bacterium]|nr:NAD(+) synthase [Oscillospiraceae bacterium]